MTEPALNKPLITLAFVATVAGCAQKPVDCSSPEAHEIMRRSIAQAVGVPFDAAIAARALKVSMARPTAFDEPIKKYSCEARITATLPKNADVRLHQELLEDARASGSVEQIMARALALGPMLDRSYSEADGGYTVDVRYTVQTTDSDVFVEIPNPPQALAAFARVALRFQTDPTAANGKTQ
jgi:hypothetical protein